jgi:hypothetical protein
MGTNASRYKKIDYDYTQMKSLIEFAYDEEYSMDTKRIDKLSSNKLVDDSLLDDDLLFVPRTVYDQNQNQQSHHLNKDIKIAEKLQFDENTLYEKYINNLEADQKYALKLQSEEDALYAQEYSIIINNYPSTNNDNHTNQIDHANDNDNEPEFVTDEQESEAKSEHIYEIVN